MQPPSIDTADQQDEARDCLAERVGELARARSVAVAVAGGMIASSLATAGRASEWFRGSLVAYSSEVKHEVLGVPPGPVVSPLAASAMARGVRRLLLADVAVGVTGAGGPESQDGRAPGTVFLAVDGGGDHRVLRLELDGDDSVVVCAAAAEAALEMLVAELESR